MTWALLGFFNFCSNEIEMLECTSDHIEPVLRDQCNQKKPNRNFHSPKLQRGSRTWGRESCLYRVRSQRPLPCRTDELARRNNASSVFRIEVTAYTSDYLGPVLGNQLDPEKRFLNFHSLKLQKGSRRYQRGSYVHRSKYQRSFPPGTSELVEDSNAFCFVKIGVDDCTSGYLEPVLRDQFDGQKQFLNTHGVKLRKLSRI